MTRRNLTDKSDRPRLIRGLRIAWSVWWGILCVLLIVLWVRSYWRFDRVSFGKQKAVASVGGRLLVNEVFNLNQQRLQLPLSTRSFQMVGVSFSIWRARQARLFL